MMFLRTLATQGQLVKYSPCTMPRVPGIVRSKYTISWPWAVMCAQTLLWNLFKSDHSYTCRMGRLSFITMSCVSYDSPSLLSVFPT